jgi:hypothetical protein
MRFMVLAALLAAAPAAAQAPGRASFRVYEKGVVVGTVETSVERSDGGWRIRGSGRTTGAIPVTIPNLDLLYDAAWRGRFMTMEMKLPDDAIVHVAVVGTTTRTDVVRAREARFQSHSVSPDTIFMPERAYGAYEAIAARLTGGYPGLDLPLFVVPIGETRTRVDDVADDEVRTSRGAIRVKRYAMTEFRERPTAVDVWADRGRLVRVDFPRAAISVRRTDVLP